MRRYILLFIFASLMLPSIGQTGKKTTRTVRKSKTTAVKKTGSINQLRTERKNMQTKIKSSKRQSESLNRMIKQNLDSVFILDRQITEVQQDVMKHQAEIKVLDGRIVALQEQMEKLQNELNDKKSKYANALKYVRKHHSIQEKMMFIFSAENLSQMLRRLRYMREYSAFQKAQGQIILDKQREIKNTRNELLDAKSKKAYNLAEIQKKQQALVGIKSNCQVKIDYLNKNLKQVEAQIAEYQKRDKELNDQIDRLVQMEIEAARKRAEAERKRKEAEAKRRAEELRKENERRLKLAKENERRAREAKKSAKSSEEKEKAERMMEKAKSELDAAEKSRKEEKNVIEAWKSDSRSDSKLSTNFVNNKGRLPMPITGSYTVVGHYGRYTVKGLKSVQLDNKGMDIKGRDGACARAVFDGEVSSVFQYGPSYIVMVRHGSYISVYSGLSSVSVTKGMKVRTRQTLGDVGEDASGNRILHFQLRKESTRLNPEQWVR